jgi:hypothetical protein
MVIVLIKIVRYLICKVDVWPALILISSVASAGADSPQKTQTVSSLCMAYVSHALNDTILISSLSALLFLPCVAPTMPTLDAA